MDDTLVQPDDGRTVARSWLVGQVADLGQYTRVVPFNDLAALHARWPRRRGLRCSPSRR